MSKQPVAQQQADLRPYTFMGKGGAYLILQPASRGRLDRLWVGKSGPVDGFYFGFLFSSSSFLSAEWRRTCSRTDRLVAEVGFSAAAASWWSWWSRWSWCVWLRWCCGCRGGFGGRGWGGQPVKTSRIFSLSITDRF